ncbi:ABC transporter permease [Nonomuraea sp. NPDC050663]|uniref:ABC transporter permease n=1 Tax=Nonomuraea sp. NPDC050663 TaxID=3364370 RepID=UPI0037B34D20
MLAFALRRFVISLPVILGATLVVFVMVALTGNPVDNMRLLNPPPPDHAIKAEEIRLHLDQPLLTRYWLWLSGLVTGDWGPAVDRHLDIGAEVFSGFAVTFRLVLVAMLVALVLAVVIGVISAVKQYTATDYTATFFGFLFLAMPSFWLAVLLKEAGVFANQNLGAQIFYTVGERSVVVTGGAWDKIMDALGHMILPTVALAMITFASWSRYQRASMLEVLNSDYVRLARAKGLRWRTVMTRHALRTALIPLTTVTAMDLSGIIGGAVVTETIFQWRGAGRLLLDAIRTKDIHLVMAWLLVAAVVVIVFNLLADLLYARLDPRIRHD